MGLKFRPSATPFALRFPTDWEVAMSSAAEETMLNVESSVDEEILALRYTRPFIMFSDLADSMPQYTWHALFGALNRLAAQRVIQLIPHRSDYEVVFFRSKAKA
jgi:hypothetical protein